MSQARTTASPTPPHAEFFPMPRGSGGPWHWLSLIAEEKRQLVRYWPVVQNLVRQELHVRYQRSVLGFLWTLLHPILMMMTMTVAFSTILDVRAEGYAVFLFAGMVPWNFLSGSLNECSLVFVYNEGLIKKIYLPKLIFPLTRVLINLTTFLLSMAALFAMLIPIGARPSWAMLALPVAVVLLAAFTVGLSLLVATATTFYRDLGHLVSVVLQAWYFLTPIIYPADSPRFATMRAAFWFNPAYPFVRMFQTIIRDARWPDPTTLGVAAGIAVASLGIGYAAFKSQENKLVFRL
jgi:ABC-type polysaccharide/polyol phosphate export permease